MSLVWLKVRKPRHDAALPSCHRRKGRATREVVRIGTEDREMAASFIDQAAGLCRQAGFRSLLFRGDTDFT